MLIHKSVPVAGGQLGLWAVVTESSWGFLRGYSQPGEGQQLVEWDFST